MAYITPATIRSNEILDDGTGRLVLSFDGNAGEPRKTRTFMVTAASTAPLLREWVFAQLADLNSGRTASTLPALQPGQTIAELAPAAPPALTAEQIWRGNARRLAFADSLGTIAAGTFATEIATLRALVASSYVSGYLGRV